MNTLYRFAAGTLPVHPAAAWYLADLGEFRGKQELYTRQSPQRLKALREHALIESALASKRIEGVSIEAARVRDVLVTARPLFCDLDEEEVRGYRDALAWIHQAAPPLTGLRCNACTLWRVASRMAALLTAWHACREESWVHPLIALAAGVVECKGRGPGASWAKKRQLPSNRGNREGTNGPDIDDR
ncbi:hypothetical protein [Accumulibacter sp.]|uniref:hypothetical protein n=1 Tax=Accumulibacter sp. TaxID=2053492 RepID=UPI0035B40E1B